MNAEIINDKLKKYELYFYMEKEKMFMENNNYLKYIKYIDVNNFATSIMEIYFKAFFFVIFFAINNFILSLFSCSAWLSLFLLILTPLFLTFFIFPYIKKFYYHNYLKKVRNNKKERDELLRLIHKKELSKSIVTDEIHDLLKLYLSNKEYVSLRKKGLTYDNIKELINVKKDEDLSRSYLVEKYSVALDVKQIQNINFKQ